MNGLVKYRLERYCEKHGIDFHKIDNTINEHENKEHLSEFTVRRLEDAAKDWKSLREWYDSLGLEELYGNIETSDEMPLLIIGCLVKYSHRMKSIVKQRLKPYGKYLDMTNRGYLIVKGQANEVNEILRKIEDVSYRVLRK